MKQSLISIALAFVVLYPANIFADCSQGFQRKIDEWVRGENGFNASLSSLLTAKENKNITINQGVQNLRQLRCNLNSLCNEVLLRSMLDASSGNTKNTSFPLKIPCTLGGLETLYEKEDFVGSKAICTFESRSSIQSLATIKAMCEKMTHITFQNAQSLVTSNFLQSAKQDGGNYYSAKLLSLSTRLKTAGDDLQSLNRDMRKSYESMSCRCKK